MKIYNKSLPLFNIFLSQPLAKVIFNNIVL